MTTGKINVQTENIFPIIKKFLYSDHEIFLRELVANAVDACSKLKTLTSIGENTSEIGDLLVEVIVNKEEKKIIVRDSGIGMTAEEVEKYINQIAFSGAEEFVNKYKDQTEGNIIGKFGLGFYSAFMVADKVEILSRSYKADASDAIHWTCDGSPDYQLEKIERSERGTEIVLHISEDATEFLESSRIKNLLQKYCKFLPIEIKFEDQAINNTSPAWVKKPNELSHEDYMAFYRELYPMAEDPLFYIHLNVDFPFNLTGILYFPRLKKNLEIQKNKIQLYCKQVFVTDSVEGIVPDFLTLLHGVIDSPDIPLNVSRSYLQSDGNVKKISNHILKKVADKLEELFKDNRTDFEGKWDDIGVFIKYGMLSEEKFYDRAKSFCLFKNDESKFFTFNEYNDLVKLNQEDKDKKVIYLYTSNAQDQHAFIVGAKNKGYDVLLMDGVVDSHFLNFLEQKLENTSFVRVDADVVDNLIKKDEDKSIDLTADEQEKIKQIAKDVVANEQYNISLAAMAVNDAPVIITRPEFMRRMKEMAAHGGGFDFMGGMPEQFNLIINANHPIIKKALSTDVTDKQSKILKQAVDLGMLSQGLLKGEALTAFIQRSVEMID